MTLAVGIDVGGSGIKGAVIDLRTGELQCERVRIDTPVPAVPDSVIAVIAEVYHAVVAAVPEAATAPVGVTSPTVVRQGRVSTASNIDPQFIGLPLEHLLSTTLQRPTLVMNDADAAGYAEMQLGRGRGQEGTVLCLTLGTGIGSALFVDHMLVPNTEFGHLLMDGVPAEHRAAARIRKAEDLSWSQWATRLNAYLTYVESLVWPELIILGGGVSRKADKFLPLLTTRTPVEAATLQNTAGMVGAALLAHAALVPAA